MGLSEKWQKKSRAKNREHEREKSIVDFFNFLKRQLGRLGNRYGVPIHRLDEGLGRRKCFYRQPAFLGKGFVRIAKKEIREATWLGCSDRWAVSRYVFSTAWRLLKIRGKETISRNYSPSCPIAQWGFTAPYRDRCPDGSFFCVSKLVYSVTIVSIGFLLAFRASLNSPRF